MGWRDDLILRAERLECGVHDTLTMMLCLPAVAKDFKFVFGVNVISLLFKEDYIMTERTYPYVEDGYVYCKSFKHWRSGKQVFPKTAKCFRFKIGG
ncbi:hypothetical protein CWO07_24245 [Vibrio splendidus]|uniref:Uncharacterized protein n=1 Tax=Vibrio splendidus TaxID=29497 RepID=A0A2T5EJC7_VIBSP|nr:hypothetical protein CWO07_24245 [Vibrio splendidus]